jgi:D-alanyl-D-alanine dipeptidase
LLSLKKQKIFLKQSKVEQKIMPEISLVDLTKISPRIQLDIRYATANNFLGKALYKKPMCYLRKNVAMALSEVQKEAETFELCLKIFDGYRPLSVQQEMWNAIRDDRYIGNPYIGKGRHTRGTAVDLTLIDQNGKELEMPSEFDEFTERAHSLFSNTSPLAIKNRAFLQFLMEKHGFSRLISEWWHFDFLDCANDELYPVCNKTFEELEF